MLPQRAVSQRTSTDDFQGQMALEQQSSPYTKNYSVHVWRYEEIHTLKITIFMCGDMKKNTTIILITLEERQLQGSGLFSFVFICYLHMIIFNNRQLGYLRILINSKILVGDSGGNHVEDCSENSPYICSYQYKMLVIVSEMSE